MPEGRDYKPGDTYTLDGIEYVVGDDFEWHPKTSLLGQFVQGGTDLASGLLSLATKGVNLAGRIAQPGAPETFSANAPAAIQGFYDRRLQNIGVNPVPPQNRGQRYARALGQVPGQAMLALATGGTSPVAEIAGATGGTLAAQTAQELGGGPLAQGAAGIAGDLLARRSPRKTYSIMRDLASDIGNARKIRAMKVLSPLDLADEGAESVMREVNATHARAAKAMESAYKAIPKGVDFPVSARHLQAAADAMIEEAGDPRSEILAKNIYVQLRSLLKEGDGSVGLTRLRALQKSANALLDTTDPARTGLAQQQGQILQHVIPAIKRTLDDMVAMGEAAAKTGSVFDPTARSATGQKQAVEALRRANKLASEYYDVYNKRSQVTKQIVEGVAGGAMLEPRMAFRKIFSDPKKQVENARAVMDIIGDNPVSRAKMRRAFVESVLEIEPSRFSAQDALNRLSKMRPVANEILGAQGAEHYRQMLLRLKDAQTAATSGTRRNVARLAGGAIGAATGVAGPYWGGAIGIVLGDVSSRTVEYLKGHFGQAAADHLAIEAIHDPRVFALLHANPRRLGQEALNREFKAALIRSGYRFAGRQNMNEQQQQ